MLHDWLPSHFLFMTRLLDGDMQLTLMSVVPCRLQIAIEKRPKFARITLIVWSAAHDMVSFSPSHLYAVLYFVPSGPTPAGKGAGTATGPPRVSPKSTTTTINHFILADLPLS